MTEPDAGSDLGAITTRAIEVDEGYLINGMKTWVTDGPEASFTRSCVRPIRVRGSEGLDISLFPVIFPVFRSVRDSSVWELAQHRFVRWPSKMF